MKGIIRIRISCLSQKKWTFPTRGYPELLQIGEQDKNDVTTLFSQQIQTLFAVTTDTVTTTGSD